MGYTIRRQNSEIGDVIDNQTVAHLAVAALRAEADLTPKPGLVDRRGPGAHGDMTHAMLHVSAGALRPAFEQCFTAATGAESDCELRATLGAIGRTGEREMLRATGGVNTHRGAMWSLGLLCAAAARHHSVDELVSCAAQLAQIPDPALDAGKLSSHGDDVRRRFGVDGARGEACMGFPHVTKFALPALSDARRFGADQPTAQLLALLALMANLDDTCILHRGGMPALRAVQSAAAAVLDAGGPQTIAGRRQFAVLDHLCSENRWSPGGSGDLLAAALFLEAITDRTPSQCRP